MSFEIKCGICKKEISGNSGVYVLETQGRNDLAMCSGCSKGARKAVVQTMIKNNPTENMPRQDRTTNMQK